MTDTRTDIRFSAPTGARRAVLLCMALGLAAMLLASLAHRLSNPSLVVEAAAPRTGQAGMSQDAGMNPEIGALMRKVAENPQDAATMIHLVEHLISDKQWEPAETFAKRAAAISPSDSQPQYLLGIILHNKGQHADAAEALERVIALKDDASARYSLGVLQIYFLDQAAKGREMLKTALTSPNASESLKKAVREELEKN